MVNKGNVNQNHPQPSPPTSFRYHAKYVFFSQLSQKTPSSFKNNCKMTAENEVKRKIG